MPLNIVRNDITKMKVDVIVNAANTSLSMGGGVCGAIFSAAGPFELQKACDKLSPIATGEAVITEGFALPSKYIIHTAGPVYIDGNHNEERLLRSCYINSLDVAKDNMCESIAFPLISSGIYGYPKDQALDVATKAIGSWLLNNEMDVSLVVFDKTSFSLSKELVGNVNTYVSENYVVEVEKRLKSRRSRTDTNSIFILNKTSESTVALGSINFDADETIEADIYTCADLSEQSISYSRFKPSLDESFSTTLLGIIDSKGKTDIEVYKRANIDRKLFSKIRTGKGYMPSKKTAIALAVALELSLIETQDLLRRAGYTLSRSVLFDVIIEYFITNSRYDIFEINNVLFGYDQPLLGG